MGKEKPGAFTPKAIANRIKSKGLQRLRWYCQMCSKQCRDENGYKCHTSSESHHRQMKIFMENGGQFISSFSSEFLKGYLDIVRRQFGGKRVHCNVVYQEYIKDKQHIHMNATRWHSLTGLCMWLGKQGICRVDETEKGWFIEYIDRDPEAESRRAGEKRFTKTEDEINRQFLAKQIASQQGSSEKAEVYDAKPLVRKNDDELIKLDLNLGKKELVEMKEGKPEDDATSLAVERSPTPPEKLKIEKTDKSPEAGPSTSVSPDVQPKQTVTLKKSVSSKRENPLFLAEKKARENKMDRPGSRFTQAEPIAHTTGQKKGKRSAIEELMAEEEYIKEKTNRKDFWLTPGIEVKLIHRNLPQGLLYRHAAVIDMEDCYTAVVRVMNEAKTKIKVDQEHVETVIPAVDEPMIVVNGAYRGEVAILRSIDKKNGRVDMEIESGLRRGRIVKDVLMEDVCKIYES